MLGIPREIDLPAGSGPLEIVRAVREEMQRQWVHHAQNAAAGLEVEGKHRDALQSLVVLEALEEAITEASDTIGPRHPRSPLEWRGHKGIGFHDLDAA